MYRIEDIINKIITGNCLKIIKEIPNDSIDLIMTSPPYFDMKRYNGEKEMIGFGQSYQEYMNSFNILFKEFFRVLNPTGNIWWNIMDAHRNGEILRLGDDCINIALKNNFKFIDQVCWSISNKLPVVSTKFLAPKYEWLLHFVKTKDYIFNIDDIRLPWSDWIIKDSRKWKWNPKGVALGNVWNIHAKHLPNPPHPAMYPEELINRIIIGWSNKKSRILDPFIGSGTTAISAIKNNRNYIGIEISLKYCKIAEERIKVVTDQFRLFDEK